MAPTVEYWKWDKQENDNVGEYVKVNNEKDATIKIFKYTNNNTAKIINLTGVTFGTLNHQNPYLNKETLGLKNLDLKFFNHKNKNVIEKDQSQELSIEQNIDMANNINTISKKKSPTRDDIKTVKSYSKKILASSYISPENKGKLKENLENIRLDTEDKFVRKIAYTKKYSPTLEDITKAREILNKRPKGFFKDNSQLKTNVAWVC